MQDSEEVENSRYTKYLSKQQNYNMKQIVKKQQRNPHINNQFCILRKELRNSESKSTLSHKGFHKKSLEHGQKNIQQLDKFGERCYQQKQGSPNQYGLKNYRDSFDANEARNRDIYSPEYTGSNSKSSKKRDQFRRSLFRKQNKSPQNICEVPKMPRSVTPKKGHRLYFQRDTKVTDSQQQTIDSQSNIKLLRQSVKDSEYFENLYLRSQGQIQTLKKQAQEDRIKFQRAENIYKQKIKEMQNCRQLSQKNLGHIYSYDNFDKNIVPSKIIVENSMQCSLDEMMQNCQESKISMLSINSR